MSQEDLGDFPLRKKAIQGATAYLVSQFSSLSIQLASTIILGRLLAPSDFGLVAMVTFFTMALMNFGFNGFTEAIIRKKELSLVHVSTIFWINLGINTLLALIFIAVTPALAVFYKEPRLPGVGAVMALTIVLSAISTQHLALMKRNMDFWRVGLNDTMASLVSVGVAIAAALHGFGYWSIVVRQVSLSFLTAAGAWFFQRWIPGPPRFDQDIRRTVSFAVRVYGSFSVNYLAKNMDKALIGWWQGSQPLGFYDRATYLLGVPLNPISSLTDVAVSTLAKLRGDREKYLQYCSRILSMLSFSGMFLSAVFFVISDDLVMLLLGPKWKETGTVFRILSVGLGVMMVYNVQGWFHLSLGTPSRWFRWTMLGSATKILLVCAALPWGLVLVAEAYVAAYYILVGFGLWYAGHPIGMGYWWIVSHLIRPFFSGLIAAVVSLLLLQCIPAASYSSILIRILITTVACATVYLTATVVFNWSFRPLIEWRHLLADMVPIKRK